MHTKAGPAAARSKIVGDGNYAAVVPAMPPKWRGLQSRGSRQSVRSQTSYLVVMMCMMGAFAIVRLQPFGLLLFPGNLVVGAALLVGGLALAANRTFSLAVATGAALLTMVGGLLTFGKVQGFALPGYPLIWLVVGLYVEMRLIVHFQNLRRQALQKKREQSESNKDKLVAESPESKAEDQP